MRPVVIRSMGDRLIFVPQDKSARIVMTSEITIRSHVFDTFLDLLPEAKSLDISIIEQGQTNQQASANKNFLELRQKLQRCLQNDMKMLNSLNLSYSITNVEAQGIKNFVSFIDAARSNAKKLTGLSLSILYTRGLYQFPDILEVISQNIRQGISRFVTDFKIAFKNEFSRENLMSLCPLFLQLSQLKNFQFFAQTSLNMKSEEELEQFIKSFSTIIQKVDNFEFDISEAPSQRGVISAVTEHLSELIALGSTNLKNVVLNLDKVGWNFDRNKIIFGNFVFGITNFMNKWPKSIRRFKLNLDRGLSFNENILSEHLQTLFNGLREGVIENLEEFELNLGGIGYEQKNLSIHYADSLVKLLERGKKLKKLSLKVSGHLNLSVPQWKGLLKSITDITSLNKLQLDIERWKNYSSHLSDKEQIEIIEPFLDQLYSRHGATLQKLHINIDDWGYAESNLTSYTRKLMKFDKVTDFQLLWYKSQFLNNLKPLELIQGMAAFKNREAIRLTAFKKLQIKMPIKSMVLIQEEEEEMLKHHMHYFFLMQKSHNDGRFKFIQL